MLGHRGVGAALHYAAYVRQERGDGARDPPGGPRGTVPWYPERRRGTALFLQGTLVGAAALGFRRHYGGKAFHLAMAEAMAPWLPAFCGSRWTVAGDREDFANALRRWLVGQFSVEGMIHLPPPARPAIPAVAVAKAVPKVALKPPPKKGLGVPYGR